MKKIKRDEKNSDYRVGDGIMGELLTWRFPDNNYTNEYGLDTSDMETFKKNPIASLAREICQNSIDASDGTKPTLVEFHLFHVQRENIPGIDELNDEIKQCYAYKKDSEKEGKALSQMLKAINKKEIPCLRISDFHTTGIEGAKENLRDTPFYNLTKGSGVSDKAAGCGGSKGIGKFASFVVSSFNTVFYSTLAKDTRAYIGISKLRSRPFAKDKDLLTMGIGYYGRNDKNYPILSDFHLDPEFERQEGKLGTDVFIIGFKDPQDWQDQVISKVLDSFMVAIVRGELAIKVGDIAVSQSTLKNVLRDDNLLNSCSKYEKRRIVSQYELLQGGDGVSSKEIEINGQNRATIYLKRYPAEEADKASNQCVMVRYPYMQIKYQRLGSAHNLSGLCIIENTELNKRLRETENPQHTDWELRRLDDDKNRKRETREMKKMLEEGINAFVLETLKDPNAKSSDLEGAGEYLPVQDIEGNTQNVINTNTISLVSQPIKRVKNNSPKVEKSGENGEGLEFTNGSAGGNTEGRVPKSKKDEKPDPSDDTDNPPSQGGIDPSRRGRALRRVPLSGIRFKTLVQGQNNDQYACLFEATSDVKNCEFAIKMWGEGSDRYDVKIVKASVNGKECLIKDGVVTGFSLKKGERYRVDYQVETKEKFASEVILYAYR